MKKTLIAGAASLALAAMPVIGAFASDPSPVTDTLTVNVNESCTFAKTSGNANSFTKSMDQNDVDLAFGSSSFDANCNNAAGYTINAEFTALVRNNNASDPDKISYSATTPAAGDGTWTATAQGGNIAATGGMLADTSTYDPAAGNTYTVTYKVATKTIQPQGSYVGTATYTLVQKSGS